MKRYFYSYQTIIRFSSAVTRHSFRLRVAPMPTASQRNIASGVFIPGECMLSRGRDCWGNLVEYGLFMDAHKSFSFLSSGEVGLDSYCLPPDLPEAMFLAPGSLCTLSGRMRETVGDILSGGGAVDKALRLSERIYAHMTYSPGSTGVDTTAAKAFESATGVCQDYAHILIALCRGAGIPARYVNGFISDAPLTHAWTEVFDGREWHGIDPTHNRLIEYGYIKLSHGRDALDCPVVRGVFRGSASQQADIRVNVEEI